jgi:hypothetical protein
MARDQAAMADDKPCRAVSPCLYDIAKIFRIQPRTQRRRPDKIDEYNRELPSFGLARYRRGSRGG